jgi:hypothetical protein
MAEPNPWNVDAFWYATQEWPEVDMEDELEKERQGW